MFAKLKRRLLSHYGLVRWGLITLSLIVVLFLAIPFLRLGKEVLFGPTNLSDLKNANGRVNILILGTGGAEHDGPDLTDTMMVASVNIATSSPVVNLISIPRDIYLDSLGGKINTAYAIGLSKGTDVGLIMAKAATSEIIGLPIHYAVRIDFSVFEKVVDLTGGVDINVENTFEDKQYPLDGKENDLCNGDPDYKCRYETIHFDAGTTHVDGKTALKFVRSRHAEGDEGTDFARAKRQQLVIKAVKDKVLSSNTLLNPSKILEIYGQLKANIDTDINPNDSGKLINLALKFRQAKFKNIVLDLKLLDNPPIDDRGWILLPKSGNWEEVKSFIKGQLE